MNSVYAGINREEGEYQVPGCTWRVYVELDTLDRAYDLCHGNRYIGTAYLRCPAVVDDFGNIVMVGVPR